MAEMKRLLMSVAERTPVAALYRSARDEWRFSHAVFAETPFGYRFAGIPKMMAGTFELKELSHSELQAYASTGLRANWATDNYLFTASEV